MRQVHFEVYNDGSGRSQPWRLRLVAANGEPVASGGEGFSSKANADRSVKRIIELVQGEGPPIIEVGD
ncbi:MAG: DUF1508 domain-containing protein [Holophagales bacterium]|nr:DUF1508 domain-containing protein [Holophagales bacterium]MYH26047.1 DUF1508 domain-containing protein [Holophagales bacterium]